MSKLRSVVVSLAAVALTAGLAAGALAQDEAEPIGVFSIEDMTWRLTGQVIDGQMTPIPERVAITLRMEGGDAGGHGGCNSYFTSYELEDFDLTFGPIGSTMMACVGPLMDLEQAYFANLGQVAAYQSGGIQMALLDSNGDFLLEFDLAPLDTVVGSWVAQGINNGNGAVETNEFTSMVTADFDADGQLFGVDGCNDYSTSYEVDGEAITIAPEIAVTQMFCEEPPAELSQQYFAALGAATTWSVDASGALELRDDDGALQVRYVPAE
jgi:heat shock protein HslJ